MKYLILGAITEAGQQLEPAQLEAWMAEIGAWYEKQRPRPGRWPIRGTQLAGNDTAKTVRAGGVTDGPYLEAKEVLGGYTLLQTPDMEAAVAVAGSWPGVQQGWIVIEVRPVLEQ